MAQICPAKSTIVPFKKQMYSSGSIILSYKDDKCICVSIHAPTRGATGHDALYVWCRLVSIHAPTRGATARLLCPRITGAVSIHAPTRGATTVCQFIGLLDKFQSTHPRGVRLEDVKHINGYISFNPRTHEGCDPCFSNSSITVI